MTTIVEAAGRARTAQRAMVFGQFASCLVMAKGDYAHAERIFGERHPRSIHRETIKKTAVAAGTTRDSVWAGPLAPMQTLAAGFVEFLRPATVIGRMSGFRKIPFNVRVPRATGGSSVAWVGESLPSPVSDMALETLVFENSKISGIVVLTKELVTSADPDASGLVRDDLTSAIAQFTDQSFLDPTLAEIAGVRPASITFGAPTVASTGSNAAAFEQDFKALLGLVTTNLTAPYLIMRPRTAISLAAMDTSNNLFKNIGARGGDIGGISVITSENVPADGDSPGDNTIILIDAAEIFMNEAGIELDATQQATVEMSSAPDSPMVASTILTSLWQNNLAAVKATRFIRWKPRRPGAVAMLTGVSY